MFRLSRIQGRVAYATKAEHDFKPPGGLRPATYAQPRRVAVGGAAGGRQDLVRERIAWQVERDFGALRRDLRERRDRAGGRPQGRQVFVTGYSTRAPAVSWVLAWAACAPARARGADRGARQAPGPAPGAPRRPASEPTGPQAAARQGASVPARGGAGGPAAGPRARGAATVPRARRRSGRSASPGS